MTDPWIVKCKKTRAYCNPIYDRGELVKWCRKAFSEFKNGNCELIVMLLPLRATGIVFLAKRKANIEFRIIVERLVFGHPCRAKECKIVIRAETPYYLDKKNKLQYCCKKCADTTDAKKSLEDKLLGAPFDSVLAIIK